jgi:hypothetical protein
MVRGGEKYLRELTGKRSTAVRSRRQVSARQGKKEITAWEL